VPPDRKKYINILIRLYLKEGDEMETPERIWLIQMGDEVVWCDSPDPDDGMEIEDAVEYMRVDSKHDNDPWYCTKCLKRVPPIEVIFEEYHDGCGGKCV